MDTLSVMQQTLGVNERVEVSMSKDSAARALTVMPKPKRKAVRRARLRGQGTIFLRGSMYWMELHWKGQRYRESLNTNDRETALIRLDDKVKSIRSGENPKTFEPISVQAMYDAWMLTVETNTKPRTIEDYKSRWENHLSPVFGKLFATQVTPDKINEYLNRRMKDGMSVCTRNRERGVLQMIFNHNSEKIPADRMPKFPKKLSERSFVRKGRLSQDDYNALVKKLADPNLFWLHAILTMTFKYGFRKSELLNAKLSYFSAKESTFTLPAFTTKNKTERVVDIVPNGEIFKMLAKLTEGRKPTDALFTRKGKPVRDYRGEWAKQTVGMTGGSGKAGCVTIHDLRRSALTGMHNKGMGAADAGTHLTADVFNRYITKTKAERQATASKIEN